nr:unnamed protein product [Callosobruchus analis]CAI5854414.1 unnamed protein product [Callosobruchus analis]
MPSPTEEIWKTVEKNFCELWNFPNCIGAIDGKHVVIEAPVNSGSLYFNYKKTFSVVLLALVDANYRFISVDVGAYGKNSDGGIFASSNMGKALNISKRTFNYRLSRARRLSENAFGILTQVFRIYQRRLKMNPEHVDKIILATCCLHNFLRPALIPVQSFDNNLNNDNIQNLRRVGGNATVEAMSIRDTFANYFSSPEGAVPWQNEIINRGLINLTPCLQ